MTTTETDDGPIAAPSSEERARLEAERLRALDVLEHGEALYVLDAEFRYVLVNRAQEALSGKTRDLTLGRRIWDVWPEAASPELKFWEIYHRVMRDRVPEVFEEYFRPRDLWSEVHVVPTAEGGIAVFYRRLNERKRAEEEVARLAQQRRLALDAAKLGWWHYDPARRHATFDARYTEIFGVVGTESPNDEILKLIHPEDLPRVWAAVEASLDPADARPYAAEYRIRRSDGALRWIEAHGVAVFEGEGGARRATDLVGTVQDITDRRDAEQAARESQQLLQATMDAFPTVIAFTDRDGRLLDVNRVVVERTGRSREELRGRPLDEVLGPDVAEALRREDLLVMATREARQFEQVIPLPTATRHHVITDFPLIDAEGRVYGTGRIAHDITDVKAAEAALRAANERLEEADRRKDEFLAVLSHELRNPLAPIRISVHLLERAEPGSEQARHALQVIDRQVGHMTRLIEDLLDVTRISRGKIELRRERVDLVALARGSADDHREIFAKNGVTLEVRAPDSALLLDGDPTRLAQVIGNLLSNAAKFTRRGGRTTLSVERGDGEAIVRVRDDGVGMSAETLRQIFEPFAQAKQTLARSRGGLGLGLALVKGLVEMHGGRVSASSEGEDRGAELTLRLPLPGPRSAAPSSPPPAEPVSKARRVLVIEDNEDAAESLREVLELVGHEVVVAQTGPEGVAAAERHRPEVVLCDIGLPGLDGFGVARALRAAEDPAVHAAFLVALSGYAQQEDVAKSRAAGFDRHVAKPLSIEALEKLLAEAPVAR